VGGIVLQLVVVPPEPLTEEFSITDPVLEDGQEVLDQPAQLVLRVLLFDACPFIGAAVSRDLGGDRRHGVQQTCLGAGADVQPFAYPADGPAVIAAQDQPSHERSGPAQLREIDRRERVRQVGQSPVVSVEQW
jgi:hypothetical protein